MAKRTKKVRTGGGAATSGGVNFQAVVTAFVAVRALRAVPLVWLEGIVSDVPVAVWAETNGPGDDICVELESGDVLEVQVKKGLDRGSVLWDSLERLALGIQENTIRYGVLAVAPDSSLTVRNDLSRDIERLGQGRTDDLTAIGSELNNRLARLGIEAAKVCANLRVRVVNGLAADGIHITAAKDALRWVCIDEQKAEDAWNELYRDCIAMMEIRGRRTRERFIQVLESIGIEVRNRSNSRAEQAVPAGSDDPKVLAQRLLLAIEKGVKPGTNGPIQPEASFREADQILQEYRSLSAVALLDGETHLRSAEFVRDAYSAIEKVRLLSLTSGDRQPQWSHADSAWKTLIHAKDRLETALKRA
ncbi:hypothetical protein I6F26_24945 [Ensifer sp. IC3342]|nr:hypothetical protein [Ensifer sp. BRP08]MCA1449807.1 hypothetical protein [Ensifer sp. IC3342]